jgi:hypothetical protein
MSKKSTLQKQFDDYNDEYFNGRLHDVIVRWSKGKKLESDKEDVCGYCHIPKDIFKPNEIVLSRKTRFKEWVWKLVLLHEMCHLDMYLLDQIEEDHHGPLFQKAMLRLAKKGAFNNLW